MFDLSLLLPTRGRPAQVVRALDTAVATAARPERIEVVFYVDLDDPGSHDLRHDGFASQLLVRPRAKMGRITRECLAASRGRHVYLVNDDIAFRTHGWDLALTGACGRWGDGIALAWGNDLHLGMPAHPCLSRTLCDLLGGICPEAYDREFIDTHVYDVFRKLRRLGHDRMLFLPDLIVEHLHAHAGKGTADATFVKHRFVDDERTYLAWDEERARIARNLARRIEAAARAAHAPDPRAALPRAALPRAALPRAA